jgi:type IV pilus assembly protein PilV
VLAEGRKMLMKRNFMTRRVMPPAVSGKSQQGMAMLEALIAVLIFSMGILALVGLQGAMVKNTTDAKYRAEATFIAQQKLGEIWANTKSYDAFAGYAFVDEDISTLLPGGTRTVAVTPAPDCLVTVTVEWQMPGGDIHNHTANARINSMVEPDTCIYK